MRPRDNLLSVLREKARRQDALGPSKHHGRWRENPSDQKAWKKERLERAEFELSTNVTSIDKVRGTVGAPHAISEEANSRNSINGACAQPGPVGGRCDAEGRQGEIKAGGVVGPAAA